MKIEEVSAEQNLQRAKGNRHSYKVSSEAFSMKEREFVLHNVSLKKEYSDEYDYLNFRRGLTYIDQIVEFKHSGVTVARKGLRKFKDLMAEYLELKESHVNTSKYHSDQRLRLFKNLECSNCDSYLIYSTQKANGENCQISVVCSQFWLIGSKNKCLLTESLQDLALLKNKHEYRQTILIAQAWFSLLKQKKNVEINEIKKELSDKTLIGQYCDMANLQHLVNYGESAQMFFYALVEKENNQEDCLPPSQTFDFLSRFNLPSVRKEVTPCKTIEHVFQRLRHIVVQTHQKPMKDGGQGKVLYVSGISKQKEVNLMICKVKTIEYRIFRKLRQKLKIYLQKYNKNYENLLKKFSKEVAQIARDFKLTRSIYQYIELAKRAFVLCEDQNRPISKFISKRYIDFLKLLQKNVTLEKFREIVHSSSYEGEESGEQAPPETNDNSEEVHREKGLLKQVQVKKGQSQGEKRILVLIPVTIPSTGKSTLLDMIRKQEPSFKIWSISSDEIKRQLMEDMLKKMKNMSRKQAFEKCGDRANKIFYAEMGNTFKQISLAKEKDHVFFIDKNHPESAIKPCIKNVLEKSGPFKNLKLQKLALLPACNSLLREKGIFSYPFSSSYLVSCLKRVLQREEHLTLEGSEEERCNVVLGFANLFRNFSRGRYHLGKYFDGKIQFFLNNEACLDQQKYKDFLELLKQILLKGRPGKFNEVHPKLEELIFALKKIEIIELDQKICAKGALQLLEEKFVRFEDVGWEKDDQM